MLRLLRTLLQILYYPPQVLESKSVSETLTRFQLRVQTLKSVPATDELVGIDGHGCAHSAGRRTVTHYRQTWCNAENALLISPDRQTLQNASPISKPPSAGPICREQAEAVAEAQAVEALPWVFVAFQTGLPKATPRVSCCSELGAPDSEEF